MVSKHPTKCHRDTKDRENYKKLNKNKIRYKRKQIVYYKHSSKDPAALSWKLITPLYIQNTDIIDRIDRLTE